MGEKMSKISILELQNNQNEKNKMKKKEENIPENKIIKNPTRNRRFSDPKMRFFFRLTELTLPG